MQLITNNSTMIKIYSSPSSLRLHTPKLKPPLIPKLKPHFQLSFDPHINASGLRFSCCILLPRRKCNSSCIKAAKDQPSGIIIGDATGAGSSSSSRVFVGSVVTVSFAVLNRVLYKLALVPMKDYPFFMAQVTTFGYVAVYFLILHLRYCSGVVTKEMLKLPIYPFIAIGFLEALGVASGMSAGAVLPGPMIPILSQSFLVWQLMLSVLILKKEHSFNQILGCLLVTFGLVLAVASGGSDNQSLSQIELMWPTLMLASSGFQAGASILKEFVFVDGANRLQGKPPDIFVVNSFGSGFQALFVFMLLPFLSKMGGTPFMELPSYIRSGAACFLNLGENIEGCEGAPLVPLLFIAVNMAFNISLLDLVKVSSALVASLAVTLAVPTSILILSLPLPFGSQGSNLDTCFVMGTAFLVLGLLAYNLPSSPDGIEKGD